MLVTTKNKVIFVNTKNIETAEPFAAKTENPAESGKVYIRLDYGKFNPVSGKKETTLIGEFNTLEEAQKVCESLTN